jgi:hypothetical protein
MRTLTLPEPGDADGAGVCAAAKLGNKNRAQMKSARKNFKTPSEVKEASI